MSGKKAIKTLMTPLRNYSSKSSGCNIIGRRYIHSTGPSTGPLFDGGEIIGRQHYIHGVATAFSPRPLFGGNVRGITMSPFGARSYCSAAKTSTNQKPIKKEEEEITLNALKKQLDAMQKANSEQKLLLEKLNKNSEGREVPLIVGVGVLGAVAFQFTYIIIGMTVETWKWGRRRSMGCARKMLSRVIK